MSTATPPPALPVRLVVPFVVKIDTREQRPWYFLHLRADADKRRVPLAVQLVRGTLACGDYSIDGLEHVVAVERKSKEDLFGTLGQGRARFARCLERLNELPHAYVVAECDLGEVFTSPPRHSDLKPKTVFRSVIAWQVRYPRVHWWFCPGRAFAEACTFRVLERVWKEHQGRGE